MSEVQKMTMTIAIIATIITAVSVQALVTAIRIKACDRKWAKEKKARKQQINAHIESKKYVTL
jgi:hypothetical protein